MSRPCPHPDTTLHCHTCELEDELEVANKTAQAMSMLHTKAVNAFEAYGIHKVTCIKGRFHSCNCGYEETLREIKG